MKTFIITVFIFIGVIQASGYTGDGVPLKYISSCEMDFDKNKQADIALLVETIRGRELLVLLSKNDTYQAYSLFRGPRSNGMHLSCKFGKTVKETFAADGKGRDYKTPGSFISFFKPESASRAYFWNGKGFKEVHTSD